MPITISYKKGDRLLMNKKVPVVTKKVTKKPVKLNELKENG